MSCTSLKYKCTSNELHLSKYTHVPLEQECTSNEARMSCTSLKCVLLITGHTLTIRARTSCTSPWYVPYLSKCMFVPSEQERIVLSLSMYHTLQSLCLYTQSKSALYSYLAEVRTVPFKVNTYVLEQQVEQCSTNALKRKSRARTTCATLNYVPCIK